METKIEQQLSIIIIGHVHTDPALYPVLSRLFKKMQKNKIPCAFLEEAPSDQTLSKKIEGIEQSMEMLKRIKTTFPEIIPADGNNGNGKYDTLAHLPHIARVFKTKVVPFLGLDPRPERIVQYVLEFVSGDASIERAKLYRTLQELEIYYTGIELSKAEFRKQIDAGFLNDEVRYQIEPIRIGAMVANIIKTRFDRFPSGGILIVATGMNHARRLGANLLLEYSKKSLSTELDVHVFGCVSDYASCFDIPEIIKSTSLAVDSSQIKRLYQSMSWTKTKIEEKDGCFSIPSLEQRIDTLIPKQSLQPLAPNKVSSPGLLPGRIRIFDIARTPQKLFDLINESTASFKL